MNKSTQYKSVIRFSAILSACVVLSLWLSSYIPETLFSSQLSPILFACTVAVALSGAWVSFRHADNLRFRKAWGWTMLVWGVVDSAYLFFYITAPKQVMDMGAANLTTLELLLGNILGWVLLLYPTEALRPGWMNWKKALWQLLPMFALVALDYAIPLNLQPVISLYPVVLVALLFTHVRAYNNWCEENYSTLDDIDVQWILRFMVMGILVGLVYMYMCLSHHPTRGFTQLWFTIFMFVYSTEQILFRKDPWSMLRQPGQEKPQENIDWPNQQLRKKLEYWMEKEKPYANPDFQLSDLGEVLAMNRTYLSQFIHSEYGCTFYQFVNRYRIQEAKRLRKEHPELKVQEISALCGFSSPAVFSRTFASITGMTPRKWARKIDSA